MRGKPPDPRRPSGRRGLIPARAGKTSRRTRPPARWSAHPRACGENRTGSLGRRGAVGSSPRVRGKRPCCLLGRGGVGLIPARAGKTTSIRRHRCSPRAHPRACGENASLDLESSVFIGSSPRVRGKRRGRGRPTDHDGLIPARAGKTRATARKSSGAQAHPRACGENVVPEQAQVDPAGSSPRVRGKLGHDLLGDEADGLIPARAGKTPMDSSTTPTRRAHPRACGENLTRDKWARRRAGSSPRVRGKR